MYCDTPQVNQLTSLLLAHGIHDVVVCPGSRNATIVHDLHEAGREAFCLHPVTDERSAAFVALGITLATMRPAAVCVTSGSALLNCLPAVAEAYYRHLPLLVVSADRPQAWIGQLDGQTLPQVGALMPYCATHAVGPIRCDDDRWRNNRTLNAALLSLADCGGRPAHINVAIEEPMFSFTTPSLPDERKVVMVEVTVKQPMPKEVVTMIAEARLPALVVGQYERGDIRSAVEALASDGQMLVLPEIISDVAGNCLMEAFDAFAGTPEAPCPDVVVQVGGNFVHKHFKAALRKGCCKVVRVGEDYELTDTFCHLHTTIDAPAADALEQLAAALPRHNTRVEETMMRLENIWAKLQEKLDEEHSSSDDTFTMREALQTLRHTLESTSASYALHLGNSSAVRAAGQVFASGQQPIFCNRGTNGIEGSLSSAVGYALKMWGLSIAVVGDLSFFYDANALWNTRLPANLRILLLNNGHGGIFDHLPGLAASPARDEFIAAGGQQFTAEGIAQSYHIGYFRCTHQADLVQTMEQWLADADRAVILEIAVR